MLLAVDGVRVGRASLHQTLVGIRRACQDDGDAALPGAWLLRVLEITDQAVMCSWIQEVLDQLPVEQDTMA